MLENYFCAPKTLRRLRAGLSGPYIDGFADSLERDGYAHASAVRYLRAAAHLGCSCISHVAGGPMSMPTLSRHLVATSSLPLSSIERRHNGLPRLLRGEALPAASGPTRHLPRPRGRRRRADEPALVTAFREWLQVHRGASKPTLRLYAAVPPSWSRNSVRMSALGMRSLFVTSSLAAPPSAALDHPEANHVVAFVPTVPELRGSLATTSRTPFPPSPVGALPDCHAVCRKTNWPASSPHATARHQAGCATARSCCCWRDWGCAPVTWPSFASATSTGETARCGSRARAAIKCGLPLPQDVGDALLAYLDRRPRAAISDQVFLRSNAPSGPLPRRWRVIRGQARAAARGHQGPPKAHICCGTPRRRRCCAMASRSTRLAWSCGIEAST